MELGKHSAWLACARFVSVSKLEVGLRTDASQSAITRMAPARQYYRRNEHSRYSFRKLVIVAVIGAVAMANFRQLDAFPLRTLDGSQQIPGRATHQKLRNSSKSSRSLAFTTVLFAQLSEREASKGIDKVVAALRKDKSAIDELGRLERVTAVLG